MRVRCRMNSTWAVSVRDWHSAKLTTRLPADGLAFVLVIEPLLEGREIIADGGGVHLARAGELLDGLLPRPALSHLEHRSEFGAGGLVVVDGAAVQRSRAP